MNPKIKSYTICGAGLKYLSKHLMLIHKVSDVPERRKMTKSGNNQ